MDVKSVSRRVLKEALSPLQIQEISKKAAPRPQQDVVEVRTQAASPVSPSSKEARVRLNKIISTVNVTSEAASSIAKYLGSIGGILEQASAPELSPERKQALEAEANTLIREIKNQASRASKSAADPIPAEPSGADPLTSQVEEQLRKTLSVILPGGPESAVGIESVRLYPEDFIIATRAMIEKAAQRIEAVRESVRQNTETVKKIVEAFEVAQQNLEASQPSLRDVDKALKAVDETGLRIRQDPDAALASFGSPSGEILKLLSTTQE